MSRYEIGRHEPERWLEWNENLRRIAASPTNIIAANNYYDAEYLKYVTIHLVSVHIGQFYISHQM